MRSKKMRSVAEEAAAFAAGAIVVLPCTMLMVSVWFMVLFTFFIISGHAMSPEMMNVCLLIATIAGYFSTIYVVGKVGCVARSLAGAGWDNFLFTQATR